MKALVDFILKFAGKNNSRRYRIVSLIFGAVFFLTVLPAVFILVGLWVKGHVSISMNGYVETVVAFAGIVTGLYFLVWATATQWKTGEGTPAPNAPTRHLVIVGPYKLCRNPIELGAITYYFGIGTLTGGIITGIICFTLGFIVGSVYHKFIEEKELEERFGEEYREYRKHTPFVFPRIKTGSNR
jgi:protein-S-isoprenylcysteine O-methyltransferase Ste14